MQNEPAQRPGIPTVREHAHQSFTRAMRDLIRLGLPIVEISREQTERVTQTGRLLADTYDRCAGHSVQSVGVIVNESMKMRQIVNSIPTIYLCLLRAQLSFAMQANHQGLVHMIGTMAGCRDEVTGQAPDAPTEIPPGGPPGIPQPPTPDGTPAPIYDPIEPNQPGEPGVPPEGDPPRDEPVRMAPLHAGEFLP